jgi:hypothetical protein
MKTWVLPLLGCLLALATQAQAQSRREIWEWTDANGVKHYSDAPAPGAKKVVIVGTTPSSTPPAPSASISKSPAGPGEAASVNYSRLEIWEPVNETSFFGSDAVVNVRIRSTPALQAGDRLLNYMDGKLTGQENALEYQISNVDRGVHSLTSVILDPKGNEKIRSASVVFYVKQQPANNPANKGPALRPPAPKPGGK